MSLRFWSAFIYLSSLSSFDSSYFRSKASFRLTAFSNLILLLCFSPSVSLMCQPSLYCFVSLGSEVMELFEFFLCFYASSLLYFSTWSALNWSHCLIYCNHLLNCSSLHSNSIHFYSISSQLILLNSLLLYPIFPNLIFLR